MGKVVLGGLLPHPPIIIPAIGKEELAKVASTKKAMEQFATALREANPGTVVVITPHGPIFRDALAINTMPKLQGNFRAFGASEVSLGFDNDLDLVREIIKRAAKFGIETVKIDEALARTYRFLPALDHGVLVPLYYLSQAGLKASLVVISIGLLPYEELYAFGKAIQQAINAGEKRVAVIASGDLSHRLTLHAPAGYNPQGELFDHEVVEALRGSNVKALLHIDHALIEAAGECGLRPLIVMFGAFDGMKVKTEVLSYEGPFGVGYAVAKVEPGLDDDSRALVDQFFRERAAELQAEREQESELVRLARQSLEAYVTYHKVIDQPSPLPESMQGRAGVFVSLKKHGQLRGCIGTVEPTQPNIAQEIIHNAISAGTGDPRFFPVTQEELAHLTYSVDVLGEPEPIEGPHQLDPVRYGVIVRSGYRSGLLLPNLEGVDTVEEQLRIAKQKAGIREGEPVKLYRFEVTRYK